MLNNDNNKRSKVVNGIGNSCNFVNENCEFLIDDRLAIATFSTMPEAEESVTVKLLVPEGEEIESAWIEGVNMYMGKIPVLLDNVGLC